MLLRKKEEDEGKCHVQKRKEGSVRHLKVGRGSIPSTFYNQLWATPGTTSKILSYEHPDIHYRTQCSLSHHKCVTQLQKAEVQGPLHLHLRSQILTLPKAIRVYTRREPRCTLETGELCHLRRILSNWQKSLVHPASLLCCLSYKEPSAPGQ